MKLWTVFLAREEKVVILAAVALVVLIESGGEFRRVSKGWLRGRGCGFGSGDRAVSEVDNASILIADAAAAGGSVKGWSGWCRRAEVESHVGCL